MGYSPLMGNGCQRRLADPGVGVGDVWLVVGCWRCTHLGKIILAGFGQWWWQPPLRRLSRLVQTVDISNSAAVG